MNMYIYDVLICINVYSGSLRAGLECSTYPSFLVTEPCFSFQEHMWDQGSENTLQQILLQKEFASILSKQNPKAVTQRVNPKTDPLCSLVHNSATHPDA